ncbi:MAG: nucleotidyl transferase AbiEii/AbiGii toxin family protein [Candidatus Omnitrophica bacterium]|nr:nucleotidyl transferase AbiEii/AbiGii toxin family protein [Candidatus Omnitrophota bacterium]
MKKIIEARNKVLKTLAGKLDGFYLAGGTALSLFYFQHRESFDLDLFTRDFLKKKIEDVISVLSGAGYQCRLTGEQTRDKAAKMARYSLSIDNERSLKVDFVEDFYELLEPFKSVNGIDVLSISDIYLRKIFTACGSIPVIDAAGRTTFAGGRQEVKDFFDLYFLSHTYKRLSDFVLEHCSDPQIESIVVWYRTYDRSAMKLGLHDIITDKKVEFQEIERHFRSEVEEIVKRTIE